MNSSLETKTGGILTSFIIETICTIRLFQIDICKRLRSGSSSMSTSTALVLEVLKQIYGIVLKLVTACVLFLGTPSRM